MKPLFSYIMEASTPKGFITSAKRKELFNSLSTDDRKRIEDIDHNVTHDNTLPSFEDIEKFFSKGEYKDSVSEYYEYVTGWLKNIGLTPKDIIEAYSLPRSGNQSKIAVIATVIRTMITFYSSGN